MTKKNDEENKGILNHAAKKMPARTREMILRNKVKPCATTKGKRHGWRRGGRREGQVYYLGKCTGKRGVLTIDRKATLIEMSAMKNRGYSGLVAPT